MNMIRAHNDYINWHKRKNSSKGTITNHKTVFNIFIKTVLKTENVITGEGIPLVLFNRGNIRQHIYSCEDRGIDPVTIDSYLRRLRAFYNWMFTREPDYDGQPNVYIQHGLPANIFRNIAEDKPAPDIKPQKYLSVEKTQLIKKKILAIWSSQDEFCRLRNRTIMLTYVYLGVRRNEVRFLLRDSLDLENMVIKYDLLKTRRTNEAPLNPNYIHYLKRYLEYVDEHFPKRPKYLFFPKNNPDGQFSETMLKKVINCFMEKLRADPRIGYFTPHWFRHSVGSHMLKTGADIATVRDFLGHTSAYTTQIYAHSNMNERKNAINNLPY